MRPSIRSLQIIAGRLGKSLDYFLGDEPLSLRKRAEFLYLAAQAAAERRAWRELRQVAEDALRLELDPRDRARFKRWEAQAELGLGNHEAAFAAVEEALRGLHADEDASDVAWSLVVQGIAYLYIGQIVAAAETLERALHTVEAHEVMDVRLRTRLLLNLGTAYRRLNRTTKAVQLYENALGLANRASDLRSLAQALMGVAVSLYDSGELDGAIANYRRALELFQRVSDQEFELETLHSLAAVRFQQGEVNDAEQFARQCHVRAESVGNARMAAIAQVELARVALANGDAAGALAIAREAERALEQAGDVKQRASALRTMGAAHHALKEHEASDAHYERAIVLAESIQLYPDVSEFAAEYAQQLRERREYERAFHFLEIARRHARSEAAAARGALS